MGEVDSLTLRLGHESFTRGPCFGQQTSGANQLGLRPRRNHRAIGVCLGLIGAVTIVVIAVKMERIEVTPILIYVRIEIPQRSSLSP
jgi:hypothetical protein